MKQTLLLTFVITFFLGSLNAQEQIPNGSFENWETHDLGFEFPTGWDNTNGLLATFADTINVVRSTDAADGSYSVDLETMVVLDVFIAPGALTLGSVEVDIPNNTANFVGGIPFSSRPLALKATIKNYPAAGNATMAAAIFTKYNTGTGQRDTIGYGLGLFPETYDTWTNVSVPINFSTTDNPDTANVYVLSSNLYDQADGGSMLVDNLSFEYEAGIGDHTNSVETRIFPNPAGDQLNFSFAEEVNAEISLFSNDGQLIYEENVKGKEVSIDVSTFATGTYYYSLIENSKKISSGQFLISR